MLRPSITVTRDTSIQDLKAFADAATGKERLKARENDDGSVTLYQAKHSKPQLWSKIMGHDKQSDAAVKTALTIMRNKLFETSEAGVGTDKAQLGLVDLLRAMPGTPSASQLRLVTEVSARLYEHVPEQVSTQRNDVPSLENMPLAPRAEVRLAAQDIAVQMAQGTPFSEMGALLERLAAGLHEGMTDPLVMQSHPDAVYSTGAELVAQLSEIVLSQVDRAVSDEDRSELSNLLSTSFHRASNMALGGGQISDDQSTITIGGTVYDRDEMIGEGGYAKIYRYTARDGSDPVAVKIPLMINGKATEVANASLAQEIPANKLLGELDSDVIIGLKGTLRSDDGMLVIVSELAAPCGDAMAVAKKITEMVTAGTLSAEERVILALTLAEDMANGLDAMHRAGVAHLDFKPANVLIGTDGLAKVADFGTVSSLADLKTRALDGVANPTWKDAHVLYQLKANETALKAELTPAIHADMLTLREVLFPGYELPEGVEPSKWGNDLPRGARSALESLTHFAGYAAEAQTLAEDLDGAAADAYSLGISIINMLRGSDAISDVALNFNSMRQSRIESRVRDGHEHIGTGGLIATLGDPALDELVNGLTAALPSDRPRNLAEFVQRFDLPGQSMIGSEAARALLMAIASGDPEAIQANRLVPTAPATPDVAVEET